MLAAADGDEDIGKLRHVYLGCKFRGAYFIALPYYTGLFPL
jgi:hypothetical protein